MHELDELLDPSTFIGRAPEQVAAFVEREVNPLLLRFKEELNRVQKVDISV